MTDLYLGEWPRILRLEDVRSHDGEPLVLVHTQDGRVPLSLHAGAGESAVICLPDVRATAAGPANGLYQRLGEALGARGIDVVRVSHRRTSLDDAVFDALAAAQMLAMRGIHRLAIIGHGQGGAAAAIAATWIEAVEALVLLATQSYGLDALSNLGPRAALLVHGTLDEVVPPTCTLWAQELALQGGARSEVRLLERAGHELNEVSEALYGMLLEYLVGELGALPQLEAR